MLVHGLHPHGVERRIEDALDSRPASTWVRTAAMSSCFEGGRRCGSPAVRGQLQELPVVGGHPGFAVEKMPSARPHPRSPRSKS